MSCELAHLDGVYVLGALSPEERLEFERHLAACPRCSRAVRQLAGLPGLLSQVSAEVLESDRPRDPVPDTLLPSLVREVRHTRFRRRWVIGLAAAAVVLALGAGSLAVVSVVGGDDAPSATPTEPASSTPVARTMTQVGQDGVGGSIALAAVAWGTRLDLTCSYALPEDEYEPDGATYALVVRSREGDVQQVATWRGLPGRTMTLTGATALTVDDIAAVEVRAADGRLVLELAG